MAGNGSTLLGINWNGLKWLERFGNCDENDDGNDDRNDDGNDDDDDNDDDQSNRMALRQSSALICSALS